MPLTVIIVYGNSARRGTDNETLLLVLLLDLHEERLAVLQDIVIDDGNIKTQRAVVDRVEPHHQLSFLIVVRSYGNGRDGGSEVVGMGD